MLTVDRRRLLVLQEKRDELRARSDALRARHQRAVATVSACRGAALREAARRGRNEALTEASTLADIAAAQHRITAAGRAPLLVSAETLREAAEAEAYAADLAPRLKAAQAAYSATAQLLDACERHLGIGRDGVTGVTNGPCLID